MTLIAQVKKPRRYILRNIVILFLYSSYGRQMKYFSKLMDTQSASREDKFLRELL